MHAQRERCLSSRKVYSEAGFKRSDDELELRQNHVPIILPVFDAGGVLFSSLFFERHKMIQRFIFRDGGVDFFQIGHQQPNVPMLTKRVEERI